MRLFVEVITGFQGSDHSAARAAIESADLIRGACDDVVAQLLGDEASIQTHEAVAYSLLARHYKRVSSHLANISTAVLGRIEDLDFRS